MRGATPLVPLLLLISGWKFLEATEVCCGDLGCFDSGGEFFNIIHRKLSGVPSCSLVDKLYLRLNTNRNPVTTQVLNPYDSRTISDSNFNPQQKTIILIHGWLDKYTRPDWKEMTKQLLKDGDHNVIRLDWSQGNWFPYMQAVANLRLVGAYAAKFVDHLVKQHNVSAANVHIIGHSLGSHGAGYAGHNLRTVYNIALGRITGLDPAGPSFTNMPIAVRLDPTDAEVVDTLVTNGDYLFAMGSPQAMGHINFYPNGGVEQPGCPKGLLSLLPRAPRPTLASGASSTDNDNPFEIITDVFSLDHPSLVDSTIVRNAVLDLIAKVGCSHVRALPLFSGGISKDTCLLKSFQCDTYDLFLQDSECSSCNGTHRCTPMGYNANITLVDKKRVLSFYTITTENAPYCAKLKVQFTLQNETNGPSGEMFGKVYLKLYGSNGAVEKILLTKVATKLSPGKTYTFMPEVSKEFGRLTAAGIYWESKDSLTSIGNLISRDTIHLDGDILTTDQQGLVSVFTPAKSEVRSRTDINARLVRTYEQ